MIEPCIRHVERFLRFIELKRTLAHTRRTTVGQLTGTKCPESCTVANVRLPYVRYLPESSLELGLPYHGASVVLRKPSPPDHSSWWIHCWLPIACDESQYSTAIPCVGTNIADKVTVTRIQQGSNTAFQNVRYVLIRRLGSATETQLSLMMGNACLPIPGSREFVADSWVATCMSLHAMVAQAVHAETMHCAVLVQESCHPIFLIVISELGHIVCLMACY